MKRTLAVAVSNTMYSYDTFQLKDYDRAVQIAQGYQRFRMTGIRITWKPEYDTFINNGSGATKPYLYYMIDKSGSIPDNVTLEALKQAGARPIAFDEKPISVMFKPATIDIQVNSAGGSTFAGYRVSPLLSTNANPTFAVGWTPNVVAHQGIKWFVDTQGGSGINVNVEVEVQFQFYKPVWTSLASQSAKGLEYPLLDDSPDGVAPLT